MTTYLGPANLNRNNLDTHGIARIYLTEPGRWEGEFLRGDPGVLWKMFGEVVTLTLDHGATGTVLVQGYGNGYDGATAVGLVGSGPWPWDDGGMAR